jgi:hypothetical protein
VAPAPGTDEGPARLRAGAVLPGHRQSIAAVAPGRQKTGSPPAVAVASWLAPEWPAAAPDHTREWTLRDGVTAADILPDELWEKVSPLIPEPPAGPYGRRKTGKPRDTSLDREVIAACAANGLLGVPWHTVPVTASQQTCKARLRAWQMTSADGIPVWERIAGEIQGHGHLAALVALPPPVIAPRRLFLRRGVRASGLRSSPSCPLPGFRSSLVSGFRLAEPSGFRVALVSASPRCPGFRFRASPVRVSASRRAVKARRLPWGIDRAVMRDYTVINGSRSLALLIE